MNTVYLTHVPRDRTLVGDIIPGNCNPVIPCKGMVEVLCHLVEHQWPG